MTKVAVIFFVGAIVSRLWLIHAPANLSIDLAQPLVVATWWGAFGAQLLVILYLTLALAFAAYLRALRAPPSLRTTVIISAFALAAGLFWQPIFSSDIYAYAAYGEMALRGINPYSHATMLGDPFVVAAQWQWSGNLPVCVYGEAFVLIASALVALTKSFGVAATLYGFRIASCCAFLACALLLRQVGGARDDERGRRAAMFLALNPVAIWSACEGHNDTWMLALVLGGMVLYRRHPVLGAALSVVSGAIKVPGMAPGAAVALLQWISSRRWQPLLGAFVGLVVVAFASAPIAVALTTNASHGHYQPFVSVQSLSPVLAIVLALALLLRARAATTPVDRFCLFVLAGWLAIPNPYPWYSLWLLPLAAWTTDRRIATAALLVTAVAMLRYIPDSVGTPSEAAAILLGLAALGAYAPLFDRAIISRP